VSALRDSLIAVAAARVSTSDAELPPLERPRSAVKPASSDEAVGGRTTPAAVGRPKFIVAAI